MRICKISRKQLAYCLGLGMLAGGCSMYESGARTLVLEPIRYGTNGGNDASCIRSRRMAKEAWKEVEGCEPHQSYSEHYARGFQRGYSDYLQAGGTGEAPLLPPRNYWRTSYRSRQEPHAIEDWFAGFRHGAQMAKASGFREQLIAVPSSLADAPQHVTVGHETAATDVPNAVTQPEKLPSPQPAAPQKVQPQKKLNSIP